MLFRSAKDLRTQEALKEQFLRQEPERVYVAVVHGHPHPADGTWTDVIAWDDKSLQQKRTLRHDPRAKEAVTRYRVLDTLAGAALVEFRLVTGKRNQIRIQAQLHGHTLVGERLYAPADLADRVAFPRQALHARTLAFRHPRDGRPLRFDAPLPDDLQGLVARLRAR